MLTGTFTDKWVVMFTNVTVTNKPFEKLAEFKYLGTTKTYRNYIHEEIRGF